MHASSKSAHGRPVSCARQQGQALIYGVFVLLGSLASLFFFFNAGQLSEEKTKLVNTADSVAYSAGVMHARALNFNAYSNRALIANEVLVAQMVSLSSWAQYAQSHAKNLRNVFPECADPYGFGSTGGALVNYGPFYAAMCYLTVQYADRYIPEIASTVPVITEALISAIEMSKAAIKAAGLVIHSPLFLKARSDVMRDVADANYANDGTVTVEPIDLGSAANAMTDDWISFTRRYEGSERTRFADVAKLAAYSDAFVRERRWTARALISPPHEWKCALLGRKQEVRRRGGTELINLDEWKAEDTESFWSVHNRGRPWQIRCRERENPIAWGEQQAHPEDGDQDESAAHLGGSPSTNPDAHAKATSSSWTNYTGLPAFHDLAPDFLAETDPRLKFTVRVARPTGQTKTAGERSQIAATPRLNGYQSRFASGEMVALSSAEVFFERPVEEKKNLYGITVGKPQEVGSLFNPYWQVRLSSPSSAELKHQQSRQGAVLPE